MATVDVAVIGGGLAGLASARNLSAAGASVCLLEARDRLGGRLERAGLAPDGVPVDLGGSFVGPSQHRVRSLVTELGLKLTPTYVAGDRIVGSGRGPVRRVWPTRWGLSPEQESTVQDAVAALDHLAAKVVRDRPWETPDGPELDSITVEQWLRQEIADPVPRDVVGSLVEALVCAPPVEVGLLYYLFYLSATGGVESGTAAEGSAMDAVISGGAGQLPEELGRELGSTATTGAAVTAIEDRAGSVTVKTLSGESIVARKVIVAMPPILAGRIIYSPPLPAVRAGLMARMPMGSAIKCIIRYERPFWREAGLSGQVWTVGPIQDAYDVSPSEAHYGLLMAFITAGAARQLSALDQDSRRTEVTAALVRAFGREASTPTGYVDRVWANVSFSAGCYGPVLGPGTLSSFGSALYEPCRNVHWAGAESSTLWHSHMEGALASAARATKEVCVEL